MELLFSLCRADMFESEEIEHFIQYCTKWSDEVKKDGHRKHRAISSLHILYTVVMS